MAELPNLPRLDDYVTWYAGRTPAAEAAWFADETITYEELDQRVEQLARALAAHGLQPGERVAVLSTPRTDFYVAWLAIMRAGLVYLGLNPRYTERELAYVVGDAKPAAILSLAEFEGTCFEPVVARLRERFPAVRHSFRLDAGSGVGVLAPFADLLQAAQRVDAVAYARRRAAVGPRDPAVIVYTSGSTGAPKGAVIPHESLVYGPRVASMALDIAQPRAACALPTNHIGCLADFCAGILTTGGMIAFVDRFDPGTMIDLIEQLRLTQLQHTPTVLQMVVRHPRWREADLSSLAAATWGGAPLAADTLRALRERNLKLFLAYGQTECISNICWADASYSDADLTTTIGRADPNQQVKLVDENLVEVPDGEPGEILARHHAQMLGYFNQPEATAAVYTTDGYLRTGDVAVRRPDGVYRIVGRRSDMYKSGGYNVYPREVELCLEAHPDVALAAVIGVPDPVYSEIGVAYLMPRPGVARLAAESLRAWCRERLANYKIPKQFVVRDELPLLPIGKVDKQRLKREYGGPTAA